MLPPPAMAQQWPMQFRCGTQIRTTLIFTKRTMTTSARCTTPRSLMELMEAKQRNMAARESARSSNLQRLRHLWETCSVDDNVNRPFLSVTPERRDTWPNPEQQPSLTRSPSAALPRNVAAPSSRYRSVHLIDSLQKERQPSTASERALISSSSSSASRLLQGSEGNRKSSHGCGHEAKGQLPAQYYSPCWYGAPPGARIKIGYFAAHQGNRWSDFFHDTYFAAQQPTAPLLRCPACLSHRLSSGATEAPSPDTTSPDIPALKEESPLPPFEAARYLPVWMEPLELQRHLSYVHADALFTPQEFRLYNAQVLHEIKYSCGLVPLPSLGGGAGGLAVGKHKVQPSRIIIIVDVANLEMSHTGAVLDMLQSPRLRGILSGVPVAICATHEVFIPTTSKVLHALYQLARYHHDSSLHVFFANTSIESGDLLTVAVLNELRLSSSRWSVPPVVLLTSDIQQQRSLSQLHGTGAGVMGSAGQVHWVRAIHATQLANDLYAALESSQNVR